MVEMTKPRMTAVEFESLPESNQTLELIEGELIVSPPPIPRHQRCVLRAAHVVEDLMPNGEVFIPKLPISLLPSPPNWD